jgi:hypothetical protein
VQLSDFEFDLLSVDHDLSEFDLIQEAMKEGELG